MRIRILALSAVFVVCMLVGMKSAAQNNCGGNPAYGTCPAPAPPTLAWCAGNNAASTCAGGTSWVGFDTTTPAAGSWTNQFEGLDAASITNAGLVSSAQADPNGGLGPTNASGTGQYLQFAGNFIQAFDRKTGNGIFANKVSGTAAPQPITTLFAPHGTAFCAAPALDGIASYDRIDGVFFIGNLFTSSSSNYFCAGVSAPSGAVPANNLQGVNGQSHWNVYAYNLASALPKNKTGVSYFPDYVRFGSWSDGFYIAFDLEDKSANFDIVGFEVCKLDKADMLAGLSTNPPACFTYIPSYVVGTSGTDKSLIHTLLPADFEGSNPIPSNTAGEYFLAQINPSNPGTNNQCKQAPCTSSQFAFWTWSGFVNGAAPTMLTLKFHPFTPGCYNTNQPFNTYCVPEPYGGVIDGLGDRLGYRLAYRNVSGTGGNTEYLAVANTVQEMTNTKRTGIRYYKFKAGATPTVQFIGDLQDSTDNYFLSMPSVAMDKTGNVGITYTVTGSTSRGSTNNYDPSPYFVTVDTLGNAGTPVPVLGNTGVSGQDETDESWGEYVSVSSDPNDDLTFWSVSEYMNGDQVGNCSSKLHVGTGCTWASRVYTCQKGNGC